MEQGDKVLAPAAAPAPAPATATEPTPGPNPAATAIKQRWEKFNETRRLARNTIQNLHQNYFKIGILVFLITLLSFGIGYLIGRDWTPAPIIIEKIENSN